MMFRQQRTMMHLAFCTWSLAVNAFAFRGIFLSSTRHRYYRRPLHLSGSRNPITTTSTDSTTSAKEDDADMGQKDTAQDMKQASQSLNQAQFLADIDQSVEKMDESLAVVLSIPWKFQGHDIYCQVNRPGRTKAASSPSASKKPIVLLIHGFGCSTVYWRETVRALSQQGYTVYSIDLLGHGKSAKPWENVTYATNLWARQLDDFCRENLCGEDDIVLIGNSMGSNVALLAATGDFANESPSLSSEPHPYIQEHIAGIGMFNCGIGMNIHSITRHEKWNPLQRCVLDAIFTFLEATIFANVALMKWILGKVVTREFLRSALLLLYQSAANLEVIVDDTLVDSLYEPAQDPNAAQVLSQILTNDPGMTPMEVHGKYGPFLDNLPIHVVWGDADTVTPIDGIGEVAQFYTALAASDDNKVTMEVVKAGHIPFDEVPDVANGSMLRWLNKLYPP